MKDLIFVTLGVATGVYLEKKFNISDIISHANVRSFLPYININNIDTEKDSQDENQSDNKS